MAKQFLDLDGVKTLVNGVNGHINKVVGGIVDDEITKKTQGESEDRLVTAKELKTLSEAKGEINLAGVDISDAMIEYPNFTKSTLRIMVRNITDWATPKVLPATFPIYDLNEGKQYELEDFIKHIISLNSATTSSSGNSITLNYALEKFNNDDEINNHIKKADKPLVQPITLLDFKSLKYYSYKSMKDVVKPFDGLTPDEDLKDFIPRTQVAKYIAQQLTKYIKGAFLDYEKNEEQKIENLKSQFLFKDTVDDALPILTRQGITKPLITFVNDICTSQLKDLNLEDEIKKYTYPKSDLYTKAEVDEKISEINTDNDDIELDENTTVLYNGREEETTLKEFVSKNLTITRDTKFYPYSGQWANREETFGNLIDKVSRLESSSSGKLSTSTAIRDEKNNKDITLNEYLTTLITGIEQDLLNSLEGIETGSKAPLTPNMRIKVGSMTIPLRTYLNSIVYSRTKDLETRIAELEKKLAN